MASIGQSLFAVTAASDNAADPAYNDGWQAGDNGGFGFEPWALAFSGDGTGIFHDPLMILAAVGWSPTPGRVDSPNNSSMRDTGQLTTPLMTQ